MPKVIVREIDNTKAVVNSYSNFSVVVPGYANSDKYEEVCDENGVYECSNASDFITYIGKVADEEGKDIAAVAPTVENYAAESLTLSAANTKLENGSFYGKAESAASAEGKLIKKEGTKYYKYTIMTIEELEACFEESESEEDDPTNKTALYFIASGNEGIDAYKQGAKVGNRLAYMLTQLGYTILYKRIESEADLTNSDFWECLKDKSTYDFRYICTGGIYDVDVYKQIIGVVGKYNVTTELTDDKIYGRGDATALIDVCESDLDDTTSQSKCIESIRKWIYVNDGIFQIDSKDVGKYVGIFAPKTSILVAGDTDYGDKNNSTTEYTIPGSIYYLACASKAIENGYAEWYPVGGYQRGISDYTVVGTSMILGERAVQLLEPRVAWKNTDGTTGGRSVNVITKIKTLGNNYYLWGSRTAHKLTDADLVASHFLNIRQLCTTLKKDIYIACKQLTFGPNDALLWIDFQDKIRPTLEAMKSNRGIKDYKMIKVTSKEKALMKAKIKIVPIEPVEDFDIGVYLEDSINDSTVDAELTETD